MSNQPLIFEDIIRGGLRPWLDDNKVDEKFAPIINDIANSEPQFQPLFEIVFYRFFNARTRYFNKLIVNEANNYCNTCIAYIGSGDDSRVIKYRLGQILKKKLPTLFKDIAKLIKANDYDLLYINPNKVNPSIDADHKTETYIIQLLKVALVKVYIEIQEAFKEQITDNIMEIEDLYLQFLSESIPENTFLKSITYIPDIQYIKEVVKTPIADKSKKSKPNTFKYKHINKKVDSFKDLLDSLKHNNLVDSKTTIYELKKIFTDDENFKPIVWTGNISDLYYFIVLIHNEFQTVESIKPYHWQITCNCFIKPDGTPFEPTQLKSQKLPKQNAEMIKKVASLLN